jgi:hypothetical protein
MDVTTETPRTSLAVRIYNPATGSNSEKALPNVDEETGVGRSDANPGGSILRSLFSSAANVSDPKVNWVLRENLMLNVQDDMIFSDRSQALDPSWHTHVNVSSSDN